MKTRIQKSNTLAASLLLCTLSIVSLPACQKAKMTSVPRVATTPPTATPAAVPPTTTPPVVQPPVVTEPTITPVTVNPTPIPTTPITTTPTNPGGNIVIEPTRPVAVFHPPVITRDPIVTQPPVEIRRDVVVSWFDSNHRPYDVLPTCRTSECNDISKQADPVVQPDARLTNKLDVLFVVDTSASLRAEYSNIAANIRSYVNALSRDTDFRFAMLIGHGPGAQVNGQSDWHGKFWTVPSSGSFQDSPVIKAGQLNGGNSSLSHDELANWLLTKFRGGVDSERIPADRTQAQGEALLSNLNQFLYKKFNQSSEFPRRDAALSIIFISDENDVCFDYAAARAEGRNLTPNFADRANGKTGQNGIIRDLPEHNSFYSDEICKYNGHHIDYKLLANALRHYYPENREGSNNMPLIVSGILYRSNSEIPNFSDQFAGDNEAGHGYLDLIKELNGEAVSLASPDFGQNLAQLGSLSEFEMQFENVIPLTLDGEYIDLREVQGIERVVIQKATGQEIEIAQDDYVLRALSSDASGNPQTGEIVIDRAALEGVIGAGDQLIVYYK